MVARTDNFVPSHPDWVQLAEAIEPRLLELQETWKRVKGVLLIPPKVLDKAFIRWRVMLLRHRSGDFRHTISELESTKCVAQWTLDKNCELRNQPFKKMEWRSV